MWKLHSGCILTTTTLQVWIKSFQFWNLSMWNAVSGFCFHPGKQVPSSQCSPGTGLLWSSQQSPSAFVQAVDPVQNARMSAISQVKRSFLLSFSQGIAFIISSPLCWQTSLLLPQPQSSPSGTVLWERAGASGRARSELHAYSPSHGAQRLHGDTGSNVVPMIRELFAAAHTSPVLFTKSDNVLFLLFTLCSLHHYKCDCTPRTFSPTRDFTTWACVGWWHFLDLFMP